jgi:hypothetical protein
MAADKQTKNDLEAVHVCVVRGRSLRFEGKNSGISGFVVQQDVRGLFATLSFRRGKTVLLVFLKRN